MFYTKKIHVTLFSLGTFLFLLFSISQQSHAYVFSFTNGTDKKISVDICGIAKIGCSMMQGKTPAYSFFKDETFDRTRRVTNAGHLNGPQKIAPGDTLELNFNSFWDIGFCANMSQVKVGLDGAGIYPRTVLRLPNDYYDNLMKVIQDFTGNLQDLGNDYAAFSGQYGPIVKASFKSTSLIDKFFNLFRYSSCKDIHFLVTPTNLENPDSKNITVSTRDF